MALPTILEFFNTSLSHEEHTHQMYSLFLTCPRILVVLMTLPMFGRNILSKIAKGVYITSLSFVIYPMVKVTMPSEMGFLTFLSLCTKEAIIGAAFGFMIAAPSGLMRSLGALVDTARGANTPGTNDLLTGSLVGAFEELMAQIFVTYFFISGADLLFFASVYASFKIWPIFQFWPTIHPSQFHWLLTQFDYFMRMVVVMTSPILVSMFLIDVGLAFLSRFVPQLQVFLIAMPLKGGIGVFMMLLYLSLLLRLVQDELDKIPAEVDAVMRFFAP